MMSVKEFGDILARSISELHPRLEIGVDKVGELAERLAISYIGHEQDGWAPLAESTLKDKAAKGYSVPSPLLRTGEMQQSIKRELDHFGLAVAVGSSEKIALYQEMGTSRIPPRPFLRLGMERSLPFAADTFGHIAVAALTGKTIL